jgi:hypothetical protein
MLSPDAAISVSGDATAAVVRIADNARLRTDGACACGSSGSDGSVLASNDPRGEVVGIWLNEADLGLGGVIGLSTGLTD